MCSRFGIIVLTVVASRIFWDDPVYHWVKYVKKEVSIVFETHVENYVKVPTSTVPVLEQSLTNKPLDKFHPKPLVVEAASCQKFLCDFMHFTGQGKPWLTPRIVKTPNSSPEWWWYVLEEINRELKMGLNFDEWDLGMPSTSLQRLALGELSGFHS